MQKISDFLSAKKGVIIWTAYYIVFMWAVLYFLFNFSIFSAENWIRLWHAHLRGFPGFVFGLLILAAAPLYVATTALVVRTGKPLITIPMPKLPKLPKLPNIFAQQEPAPDTAETAQPAETAESPAPAKTDEQSTDLPNGVPNEMRGAFMRARRNAAITGIRPPAPKIAPDAPNGTDDVADGTLPLPVDFDMPDDFAMPDTVPEFASDAPVFKDITFDDAPGDAITPPPPSTDDAPAHAIQLAQDLAARGCNTTMDGDIIITDKFAIAMHDDNNFWIPDEEIWFAAGKSKPSPIVAATDAARRHNVRAALYLGSDNIMDLDNNITQWSAQDIHIARTPDELV